MSEEGKIEHWRRSGKFWRRLQRQEIAGGETEALRARVQRFVRNPNRKTMGRVVGELTGTVFRWETFTYTAEGLKYHWGETSTLAEAQAAADKDLGIEPSPRNRRKPSWRPVERALEQLAEALGDEDERGD